MQVYYLEEKIWIVINMYNIADKDWKETRPKITTKVYGKSLIPQEWSDMKMVLTKVEPGGEFSTHIDAYHHIFYYLEGTGIGWIEDEEYEIQSGLVVEVLAGKKHGYRNSGSQELILITLNIPKK